MDVARKSLRFGKLDANQVLETRLLEHALAAPRSRDSVLAPRHNHRELRGRACADGWLRLALTTGHRDFRDNARSRPTAPSQ